MDQKKLMTFYRIGHQIEKKLIGYFPQIQEGIVPTTVHDPRYISYYMNRALSQDVLVPELILYKKAKLTDLLSASFMGLVTNLVVSLRLAGILQKANRFGIEFIDTKLHFQNGTEQEDVVIIHPYRYGYEFIDFQRSQITLGRNGEEIVHFVSGAELDDRLKEDDVRVIKEPNGFRPVFITSLSLIENPEVDFFSLRNMRRGGVGFFVSERLKSEIEDHGCTGIEYEDLT